VNQQFFYSDLLLMCSVTAQQPTLLLLEDPRERAPSTANEPSQDHWLGFGGLSIRASPSWWGATVGT
jgi:hypothetical protein